MDNALTVASEERSFFALSPRQMTVAATQMADVLKDIIKRQKLSVRIGPNEYVKSEGWATLGSFLGVLPRERNVIAHDNGDYEAYVDLVNRIDGIVVGGASSLCGADEKKWGSADRYARRSMAITRATGKAYRLSFAWIMTMAGYQPTPYEEMPHDDDGTQSSNKPAGYDPQNRQMQDWLLAQLKKAKVDEGRWDDVGNAMKGRPSSDFAAVLEQVVGP